MRLFVAVNLNDATRAAIDAALDAFPLSNPPWRWSAPATWHITLKFIGDASREDAHAAGDALARVAAGHAPFDLTLGRFAGFPALRNPRVLFYAADAGSDALAALARDVDAALVEAIGVEPETRRFHPHVTVARVKDTLNSDEAELLAQVPSLAPVVQRVASIDLMESRLGPRGAAHSVARKLPLGATRG